MHSFSRTLYLTGISLVALMLTYSCQPGQRGTNAVISTSIEPLSYIIDRLTGQTIAVNVMVPAGASHGSYSPTTQQFKRLSDSGLYVRIGYLGYEQAWIGRLRELNPTMKVVNLSDHVALIRGMEIDHGDHKHEGGVDPHIWMSPKVMLELLPLIRDAILEVFPELEASVNKNYPDLYDNIALLHNDIESLAGGLTNKSFMIYHPALTYLARDYGFNQVSVEHEGKEPSPAMLSRIIRDARQNNIPIIFIQEEYDRRSAELISKETGAILLQINPLAYDWIGTIRHIHDLLSTYLP